MAASPNPGDWRALIRRVAIGNVAVAKSLTEKALQRFIFESEEESEPLLWPGMGRKSKPDQHGEIRMRLFLLDHLPG